MQKNSQMFMFGDAYGKALDDMNKGIMELDNETLTNLAILRDNIRDQQGDVLTFDIPEREDDLMDYDEFYDMPEEQSRGILDILKTAGGNVLDFIRGGGFIGRGITGLANMLGDTFRGSRFYNPRTASGNRLFAPGARAGDAVGLNFRRDANRFGNMLNRLAAGKRIGRSNLTEIMGPARLGLTGIDVEGMAQSIRDSQDTGYGGFGSASAAAAEAAASGGRDYSSSPGAMAGDMEYDEE